MVSSSMGKIAQVLPNSGDMLPMVARSASGRFARPSPKKFHELVHHAFLAQHLGNGEHEIRCGGAGRQLPVEPEADDLRNEHGDWLTEHGRFGFDAAHAPSPARRGPLIIVVCESVPTTVSG